MAVFMGWEIFTWKGGVKFDMEQVEEIQSCLWFGW